MPSDLIGDNGRGLEILGTRLTVYDLLPYFFDPTATEGHICKIYDLTGEQVAAARASVFENADTILAKHLEIEARLSVGNPPELVEQAKATHQKLLTFKEWLAKRQAEDRDIESLDSKSEDDSTSPNRFPSFREWLSQQETQSVQDS